MALLFLALLWAVIVWARIHKKAQLRRTPRPPAQKWCITYGKKGRGTSKYYTGDTEGAVLIKAMQDDISPGAITRIEKVKS